MALVLKRKPKVESVSAYLSPRAKLSVQVLSFIGSTPGCTTAMIVKNLQLKKTKDYSSPYWMLWEVLNTLKTANKIYHGQPQLGGELTHWKTIA